MIGAMVAQAARIVLDGGNLSITFGSDDDHVRKMLTGDENVRTVEAIAAKTLGRPVTVRIEGGPPVAKAPSLSDRASDDPAVRRLVGEFGAHLVDVRPPRETPPTEDIA